MKKSLIYFPFLSLFLLISCNSNNETINNVTLTSQNSTSLPDSGANLSSSSTKENDLESPFTSLNSEDPLSLNSVDGFFYFDLYYDRSSDVYSCSMCDYSLGDYCFTFLSNLSEDTYELSFTSSTKSKFLTLSSDEIYKITFDKHNGEYAFVVKETIYKLTTEKVTRKYFLNPDLVGNWDIKENETSEIFLNAQISNVNFEPIIKISDGDVLFNTNLSFDEKGAHALIVGEANSDNIKVGDELIFFVDYDNNTKGVTYNEKIYYLYKHVDTNYDYVAGYFYFETTPNGTKFSYDTLTIKIGFPVGKVKRAMTFTDGSKVNGDYSDYENEGAVLTNVCTVAGTSGYLTVGVTYRLCAIYENENIVIRFIGNDGSNIVLTKE